MAGHTYSLALQDISLKRFRLRYSVVSDCYYLHWDQTVCPQLARIEGLAKGAMAVSGLTRCTDQEGKRAYLSLADGVMSGEIEWRLDFSHSGLAVKRMLLKAESVSEEGGEITHVLTGNGLKLANSQHFGGRTAEVPQMCGHSIISIKTVLTRSSGDTVMHFLPGTDTTNCPLDVTVELMVPRIGNVYIGEILLGLKFGPYKSQPLPHPSPGEESSGQLHVHIVEGAGICSEETHQPFNALAKCAILPDSERCPPKQTSPRLNVYPTWTKEFVFPGLSKAALSDGGMEVILYDHHRLHSDVNIGGVRLCVPRMKEPSPVPSPVVLQREASIILFGHPPKKESQRPLSMELPQALTDEEIKGSGSLHRSISSHAAQNWSLSPPSCSPLYKRREVSSPQLSDSLAQSFPRSPQLSPSLSPRTRLSPFPSPRASPRTSPRTSPKSSPKDSPIASRKSPIAFLKTIHKSLSKSSSAINDTDYVYWWMDSTPTEVRHWKDVLEREGEWVYCWHVLRPKLQPAASSS